ncbi:MAG: ChaN family lipoprotein, partial [Halobacteriovoraceae bacterium]|nr:ChaN family lipoprotein [Halobacteriovoraceae bacterium]
HLYYASLFEKAKTFGGKMVATNAPRPWKSIIVKQGFGALSADRIPSNMERGSKEYLARFKTAIGGHGSPQQIENYFMAQSYTDAVMAKSLVDLSEGEVTFMIVGSFHSDFDHGLPTYLRKISNRPVQHIRILDFKGLSKGERADLLKADPQYGDKASLYLIINK